MAFMIDVSGMKELQEKIKKLQEKSQYAASMALYEGARIVADEVSRSVRGITTEPFHYATNGEKRKPSPEEKAAIKGAPHGVAKFRKKLQRIDTSVGWNNAGYVDVNWNHMNSKARTNYKAVNFKGREHTASSTLKWIRDNGGSEKYGLSSTFGRHAQNQKPVGAIANAINSGTSFMEKQPFMRKAFTKSKSKAIETIEAALEKRINEMIQD